ncbi:hypothetical protein [Puia dinghuensis]|uniref:6-bladed beta-propeller n=1 Tax=Puia dinghuensis TaxID=1792502 RepID=A0A8J2UFI3_9BACT|nr:hypothetical protein [Puia dinghuensis]GGB08188.1 hypothetical protein GCM10011511_34660 [Puia dinghuensis]
MRNRAFYLGNFLSPFMVTLLFCGLAPGQQARAQQSSADTTTAFRLTQTFRQDIVDFTIDNLGNIYVLNKDNQLKKLGPQGDSLAVFNAVTQYGRVASIDATNPLKILVYYREFTTIIELDRFLNIVNTIDLRKLNILQAKAVGLAYDNNVWVFDELDAILKRIGDDGSLVDKTTDFRQLFDSVPDPAVIRDQGGLVYLYDPQKGVYIFDHYGTLKTHLDLRGWQDFDVIDKNMLGHDDHQFYRYQPGTLNMQEEPIPTAYNGAIRIRITPAIIYVLKTTGLEVYSRK